MKLNTNLLSSKSKSEKVRPWQFFSLILLSFLMFAFGANAQSDQAISGKVIDNSGSPVIGATVLVKGTTRGTSTDATGSFKINVPKSNKVLVFSFLGFKAQEVNINDRSVINVSLEEDNQALNEVVVIGYGVQKKSDLVGSVASLKGSDVQTIVTGNATSALQGKMAGIQIENNGGAPGGDANVFVRGVSSLTNSFPLYVIDGTFADNMSFLNPQDIESIEVLKDASSAAIYGSRAANGVVIITTKKGKSGAPKVTLTIRGGFETPSKKLSYLTGSQFVAYRNQLEQNDKTGFVLKDDGTNTDWQEKSLKNGAVKDYGLSISGGGENSTYFISGNAYSQDGILVNSGFDRYNFRANSQFKMGKFTVSESLSLLQSDLKENNWFGFDGTPAPIYRLNVAGNEGGYEAADFNKHNFNGNNTFAQAEFEKNNLRTRNIFGNVNVAYEIIKGLTAKLNFGIDYSNTFGKTFTPTFFMSNSNPVFNVNKQNDLTEVRSDNTTTLFEPTLSYAKDLNASSNLNVVVGYTRQKIDYQNSAVYVQGLPNNDISVLGAAAPSNVQNLAGLNNVSGLESLFGRVNFTLSDKYLFQATIRRDASSKFAPQYRVGYFPSVSLGWKVHNENFFPKDGVINTLKIRGGFGTLGAQNIPDYSYQSVFSLTSNTSFNNQTATGYAQTAFALEDVKWETSKTVNIGADFGLWKDKLVFSVEYYNKQVEDILVAVNLPASSGTSLPVIKNAGAITNSGVELEGMYRNNEGALKYSVGFNLGTLNSKVTKLPNPVIGPSTSEAITRVNRFIEGQAPGVYWGYQIQGVYANQAAIDADPNIKNDPTRKSSVQPGDFIRKDLNGDGKIDGADETILGDPTPDFTYGFNFNGKYKNFDLGIVFNGVQGNEIYNLNKYYNTFWPASNKLTDVLRSWTPTNQNTDVPRATAADPAINSAPSSYFVEDGSYLRLRTLELGYTLPKETVGKFASSVRVFVSGQNLLTLTKYSGYNPDVASTNGGRANRTDGFYGYRPKVNPLLGRGLDARAYPNATTFMAGVQIGF
jgi:TonB-dependent starch-binding outer membrane protein SusC